MHRPRARRPTPVRTWAWVMRARPEAQVAVAEARNGTARWSRFVPLCAILALLGGAEACLNPIPDDFPNSNDDSAEINGPAESPPAQGPATDRPDFVDEDEGSSPQPAPDLGGAGAEPPDAGDAGAGSARAAARRSDAGPEPIDAGVSSGALP